MGVVKGSSKDSYFNIERIRLDLIVTTKNIHKRKIKCSILALTSMFRLYKVNSTFGHVCSGHKKSVQ